MSTPRVVRDVLVLALWVFSLAGAGAADLGQEFQRQLQRAEAGDVPAMYAVGEMYELGIGTDSSRSEALKWYRAAAERGHPGGAYQLGYAYYWGKGVKRDRHTAHDWFLRAAEGGNQPAMPYLSKMYALGQGVAQDKAKAAEWASRADTASNLHKPPPVPEAPAPKPRPAKPPEPEPTATDITNAAPQTAPAPKPKPAAATAAPAKPQPQPRSEPAPKPQPKPKTKPKPAKAAKPRQPPERIGIKRLKAWDWEKGDNPALYLPSSLTECHDKGEHLDCASISRRSSLLGRPYAFRLLAVIAGFDRAGKFQITYRPQVTGVLEAPPGAYGDDGAEPISPEELHARVERQPQTMDCRFDKDRELSCTDGLGRSQVYQGVAHKPKAPAPTFSRPRSDSDQTGVEPPPSPPPQQEAQAESRRTRTVGPPP